MFSICMKSVVKESDVEALYFRTVLTGMRNLAIQAIVPDLDDPFAVFIDAGFFPMCLYATYVFIVGLTMMNMLIGVLCEVIAIISKVEREEFEMVNLRNGLIGLIMSADTDNSGDIGIKEFVNLLNDQEAVKFLVKRGHRCVGVSGFFRLDLQAWQEILLSRSYSSSDVAPQFQPKHREGYGRFTDVYRSGNGGYCTVSRRRYYWSTP